MECKRTRDLCTDLRARGAMVFAVVGSVMQEPGWPDRYVHHVWWSGWIEFKDGTRRLTPKQQYVIRELNARRPCSAFVVRFPDRVENDLGDLQIEFDGSAMGLLLSLQRLTEEGDH